MHPLAQIGAGLACFGAFVAACFIGVTALIRYSPADPEPDPAPDDVEPTGHDGMGAPTYPWQEP